MMILSLSPVRKYNGMLKLGKPIPGMDWIELYFTLLFTYEIKAADYP